MAIDVTEVTADLAFTIGVVGAVGLACLLMYGLLHAIKTIRSSLGYSDVSTADLRDTVDHHAARTAAWDSGYMRRQFDPSWSAEEKAAWREGVAAQHEDKRKGL